MDIGTLSATLQFNVTDAMGSMTKFEQIMVTLVNRIDSQLEAMSKGMLRVGTSATIMGNQAVTATEKIIAATTAAKDAGKTMAVAGLAAISPKEVSNRVSELKSRGKLAEQYNVPPAVISNVIDQKNAELRELAKKTQIINANRIKEANAEADAAFKRIQIQKKLQVAAIEEDNKRTSIVNKNRIREANAEADAAYRRIQIQKKLQERALIENVLRYDTKPAMQSLENFSKSLSTVSQKFRTFGYLASVAITAPIVMLSKSAFNMAKDFEFSIQKIVGLAGVAQHATDAWMTSVLKLAPELGRSPKELADALYFIASSGIKGAQALDVLKVSGKAAVAGLGETKAVADLVSSALNAYAGTGLTATRATDILVAAVREGKAEADSFSASIGSVIPLASEMGVSLDQVAGAMAAITLTGSTAAQAATYLKGVFNSLAKGSETIGRGAEALTKMHSSYSELRHILRDEGLIPLMQKMRDMQAEYGETLAAKVFPNIRALTAYLSISGKNFKYNTELMERVTNSAGSLGAAFAAVSNTIKVRYDRAIANAQVGMISFGKSVAEVVIPVLEKWGQKINNLGKWFDELTEVQKRHKLGWIAFLAILGPASLLLSVIGYTISGLISVVVNLSKGLVYLTNVIKAATGSQVAFNAAMASSAGWTKLLLNPWTFLSAAIVIATIALSKFITEWSKLPDIKQFSSGGKLTGFSSIAQERMAASQTNLQGIGEMGYNLDADKQYGEKSIQGRIKLIKEMNKEQLETLKNDIDTRIQLEQDGRIKLLETRRQGLRDDQFILDQKKKLDVLNKSLSIWNRMALVARQGSVDYEYAIKMMGDIKNQMGEVNKSLSDYNLKIQQELEKNLGITIPLTIKNLKIDRKKVEDELKAVTDPILKEIARKEKEAVESADIAAIWDKLVAGELRIVRMTSLLGDAFDSAGERAKLYQNILEELSGTTISLLDKKLQNLAKAILLTTSAIKPIPEKDLRSALGLEIKLAKGPVMPGVDFDVSLMQRFQSELDLIVVKNQAMGQSFNTARDQLSLFKETLNRLWDADYRPEDDIVKYMITRIKELTTQQQIIDALTDSFTNLFISMTGGFKKFGNALKDFANQIIQSFTRIIAQNLAEKLINSIIPKGGGKGGGWLGFLGKILGLVGMITPGGAAIKAATTVGLSLVGLAKGGTVPSGFPNDTYPALLTSGETVIPKGLNNITQLQFEPVEFVIKENQLVGILRKANTRKQLT